MITNEVIRRRPRDQSELPEWYAQLFEAQRVDELTTQEVASLLNVTPSNLYSWRRRLRSAETSAAAPPDSQGETSARGLVRVHVTQSEKSECNRPAPATLEVRLGSNRSILVPVGFEPDNLRTLVATLESC